MPWDHRDMCNIAQNNQTDVSALHLSCWQHKVEMPLADGIPSPSGGP